MPFIRAPELLFAVGTTVEAPVYGYASGNDSGAVVGSDPAAPPHCRGVIAQIRDVCSAGAESDRHITSASHSRQTRVREYYVRFNPPVDPSKSAWLGYRDLQFVSTFNLNSRTIRVCDRRSVQRVVLWDFVMETWYYAPYPAPYHDVHTLYICPRCFKYMRKLRTYTRHVSTCQFRVPVGLRIYDDGVISFYEVDGRHEKLYSQNICLLSKLFLDGKSLIYDCDTFLFYVMTVRVPVLRRMMADLYGADLSAYHNCAGPSQAFYSYIEGGGEDPSSAEAVVGYFSKEKPERNVLACILTLPCYMRLGVGLHLTEFSYMLARIENRQAGPEEPLSAAGRILFTSYWRKKILAFIVHSLLSLTAEELLQEASRSVESTAVSTPQTGLTHSQSSSEIGAALLGQAQQNLMASTGTLRDEDAQREAGRRPGEPSTVRLDLYQFCDATSIHIVHAMDVARQMTVLRVRRNPVVDLNGRQIAEVRGLYREMLCKERTLLQRTRLDDRCLRWEPYTTMFRRKEFFEYTN